MEGLLNASSPTGAALCKVKPLRKIFDIVHCQDCASRGNGSIARRSLLHNALKRSWAIAEKGTFRACDAELCNRLVSAISIYRYKE